MKKIIAFFLVTVSLLILSSCKKNEAGPLANLPWRFTLQDTSLNRSYNYSVAAFGTVNEFEYPTFKSQSFADSSRFETSCYFTNYLSNSSRLSLSVTLLSLDNITARQLLASNTLLTKQNALKNIFLKNKIYYTYTPTSSPNGLLCSYTTENGQQYANNVFNPACNGSFTITDSQIWEDGTGIPKIKVWLNYSFVLQATVNNGTWLTEIKKVTGTMQTFYTVQ